jgi:sugar phosphate isomerase/epimerase
MVKRTLSLGSLTFVSLAPEQIARTAAAAGFESIGVRAVGGARAGDPSYSMLDDPSISSRTRSVVTAAGLSVLDVEGIRLTQGWRSTSEADRRQGLVECAAEFGARRILVFSELTDENETVAALGEIASRCEGTNVRPALEFAAWSGVTTLTQAVRVSEQVGHPLLGILIDTLHLFRTGGSVQALSALSEPAVSYIQLSDAVATPPAGLSAMRRESRSRLIPGQGGLPLSDVLAVLPDTLPISLEVPTTQAGIDPVEWARRLKHAGEAILSREAVNGGARV